MNDLYFGKLYEYYLDTKFEENSIGKAEKMLGIYERVLEFSRISRTKGLLDLGESAMELNDNNACELYLKKLVMFLVEGTDPKKVEEVGLTSVISGNYDSFDAIICLMCLRGVLLMQEGECTHVMGEMLRALFPSFVMQAYQDRLDENRENRKKVVLQKFEEVKKKCDESYYGVSYRIRLSEYILQASVKELAYDYWSVNVPEWARASRALSGDAVKRLINILDVDEAERFIEEVEHNSIRLPFAEESCECIYKKICEPNAVTGLKKTNL